MTASAAPAPTQFDLPFPAAAPGRGAAYDRAIRDVAEAWRVVARSCAAGAR